MTTKKSLWGVTPNGTEINIPVLGICGEFSSGKTLFGLTIAPGVHPEGHAFAGKNRTLVIDAEKSSLTYNSLPFDRVDVPDELMLIHKGSYSPIQMFEWFKSYLEKIPAGRYDVIFIDPITDFDSGLTDYVKQNISKFGMTAKQLEKSSGLLWGIVKEQWNLLLNQIATKCKTFVFSAHMGFVWVGSVPTTKREPRGKETLTKLASLYLELIRVPDKNGIKPTIPSGKIIKGRVSEHLFDATTGEIQSTELIPISMPKCTPTEIRNYIASPFKGENVVTESPIDENVLLAFKADIERNRNEANQGELEILRSRQQLAEIQRDFDAKKSEPKQTEEPQEQTPGKKGFGNRQKEATSTEPLSIPEPPVATREGIGDGDMGDKGEGIGDNIPSSTPGTQSPAPTLPPVTVDFPPHERDNSIVKKAVDDGFFTKEDFLEFLASHKTTKLSDLSDDGFEKLEVAIEYLKTIRAEAVAIDMAYHNVRRFAEQVFKLPSHLMMSIEQFEQVRQFIAKGGNSKVPF